jgi:hypothetical protein
MRKLVLALIAAFGLGVVGVAQAGEGCAYGGHEIKSTETAVPLSPIKTTTVTSEEEEPGEPG